MKKSFLRIAAAGVMALLLCTLSLPVFSYELAYNLYLNPDLSQTEGVFSTYVISFNAPPSGLATSWLLASFSPYVSQESAALYPDLQPGGSIYSGLQIQSNQAYRSAYLSMPTSYYTDGDKTRELFPKQLYPSGNDAFENEAVGTINEAYPFIDDRWYTMVLHTWEEPTLGTTLLGQWFLDAETGIWTLTGCFDTGYIQSGMTGPMTAITENYSSSKKDSERSFKIGGIYARNKSDGAWNSISTASIYGGGLSSNTLVGSYEFGAEESYFWGRTNGTKLENQEEFDRTRPAEQSFTITQPESPSFGEITATDLTLEQNYYNHWSVSWNVPETSTPAVSYRIEVFDEAGARITEQRGALPYEHQGQFYLADYEGAFTCALTLTDPFGKSVTIKEQGFADQKGSSPSPSPDEEGDMTKEEPAHPSDEEADISPAPKSPPTPSPALPFHPQSDDPQGIGKARKAGLLVALFFFATGILAALITVIGMVRNARRASAE